MSRPSDWVRKFLLLSKHENTRYVIWLPLASLIGGALLCVGRSVEEAILRAVATVISLALIDVGVFSGIIRKQIQPRNRGRLDNPPTYVGRSAVIFGTAQAIFGFIALIFFALAPF